jgi:hypothetical protein
VKETKKETNILRLAIVVSIVTYLFWDLISNLGYDIYYIGNALFIFLLALYIKQVSKPSFLTFFLFCLALNNLLDELLFDNTKFGINEIIATILLILVYYFRTTDKKDV